MGDKITLKLDERTVTGKKVKILRSEGLVPAVIYGRDQEPLNAQLPQQEARSVVARAGRHTPVQISLAGKKKTALIKSVEYAPARRDITHLSLQAVRADEVVTTEVPLVLVGADESPAAKSGLIILPALEDVEVRAKTSDLPDGIELDATKLTEHGDKLTIADIRLPKGVELVDDNPEVVIASVYEPAALEAKNAAADEAADEARAAGETAETETAADASSAAENE